MKKIIKVSACCMMAGLLVTGLGRPVSAQVAPTTVLERVATPEEAGFDSSKLAQMDVNIQAEINAGYPGLNLLVIKDGKIAYQKAYGDAKKYDDSVLMADPIAATTDTMYDLASNSKMYATNFALQKLVSEGKLDVEARVADYIPDFKDEPTDVIKGKDTMKLSDILHHNAGFPADPQYPNQAVAGDLYSQDKATTLEKIIVTPLQYEPGTQHIYSDVDYMLLGFIIESVVGMPLDTYVETEIYAPLGLTHTMFNPLQKGITLEETAATELNGNTRDGVISFPNIRTHTVWGEVHDEKAYYSMGGVSGHAGLFSNTDEMAVLMQLMLNGGTYNGVEVFSNDVANEFTASSAGDATYGLGWRVNGGSGYGSFGKYASPTTYGHTGWTGTLTLIDPENDMAIVLLGNRPHSPVIDPNVNPNAFESGNTRLSAYSWTVNQIYEALLPLAETTDNNIDTSVNNSDSTINEVEAETTNDNADATPLPTTGQNWWLGGLGVLIIGSGILLLRKY